MKLYMILIVLLCEVFVISCTNCTGEKNTQTPDSKDSVKDIDKIDTIDSIHINDSVSVNVYEVVEDTNANNDGDAQSPAIKVSKRGENTVQNINDDFALQGNGIGAVRIGTDISKLPKADKGLYDKKSIEGGELLFYKGKDLILEVTYNKKNNLINSIRVTSPNIKTEDGICQFMNFDTLMKNEKARKAIGKKNKYNLESFSIDGITYEMEENIEGDKYVSAIIIK